METQVVQPRGARCLLPAACCVATVLLYPADTTAQNGSREGCFCPVERGGGPSDHSEILNAAICVNRDLGTGRCRTTIECLDDGVSGPSCPTHPERAGTDLNALFDTLPALAVGHAEAAGIDLAFSTDALAGAIDSNAEAFQACLDAFATVLSDGPSGVPFRQVPSDDTFCNVTPSGTLQFAFTGSGLGASTSDFKLIGFQFVPTGE